MPPMALCRRSCKAGGGKRLQLGLQQTGAVQNVQARRRWQSLDSRGGDYSLTPYFTDSNRS